MHISTPIATLTETINEGRISSRHGIPEDLLTDGVSARPAAAFEKVSGKEFADFAQPLKGRPSLPVITPERHEQVVDSALPEHSTNEDHSVPVVSEPGSIGFSGQATSSLQSWPGASVQMNAGVLAADGQVRDQVSADRLVSHAITDSSPLSGKMPKTGGGGDGENVPADLAIVFLAVPVSGANHLVQPVSMPSALSQDSKAKPTADVSPQLALPKETDLLRLPTSERILAGGADDPEAFANREMRSALSKPSAGGSVGSALVTGRNGQGEFIAEYRPLPGSPADDEPRNHTLPASMSATSGLIVSGFQENAVPQGNGSGGTMTPVPVLPDRPPHSSELSGMQGAVRDEAGPQKAARQAASSAILETPAAGAALSPKRVFARGPAMEPVVLPFETGGVAPGAQASGRIASTSAEAGSTTSREPLPSWFGRQIAEDAADVSEKPVQPISHPSERFPLPLAGDGMTHGRVPETTGMERSQIQHGQLPIERHAAHQIAMAAAQFPERPVELVLSPEELGRVRITLSLGDNNAITVSIVAERPDTLDLMRRNIPALAQEFRDIGYHNTSFSFGPGSGGKGDLLQAYDSTAAGSLSSSVPEEQDICSSPSSTALVLDAPDRLDLRL